MCVFIYSMLNDVIISVRLKLISGKDSFILEPCFSNTVFETLSAPFSKPNELNVLTYIAEKCEEKLSEMNALANREDDLKLVQKGGGDNRECDQYKDFLLAKLRLQVYMLSIATSSNCITIVILISSVHITLL